MLLIPCPHCGPRAEIEFVYGGAVNERPADPALLDAKEWSTYVFTRTNLKGLVAERWWHAQGCRQWLVIARDTATNAIAMPNASFGPA